MPRSNRRVVTDVAALVGADIEVRTLTGAVIRGRLLSASAEWLAVEKATTGRLTLVRVLAVASIQDERAPLLQNASAREAEAAVGAEV